MKKIIIVSAVSFVVGILIVLVGYFAYSVVKMQTQVNQNTATLVQIVDFLNKNIQAQTPATTAEPAGATN